MVNRRISATVILSTLFTILSFVGCSRPYPVTPTMVVSSKPTTVAPDAPVTFTERDVALAISEISKSSGIPKATIEAMSNAERKQLAEKFMAQKLGKQVDEVHGMSQQELFDTTLRQLADQHGISYEDMKHVADIQQKADAGHRLSPDEAAFMLKIETDLRRNKR